METMKGKNGSALIERAPRECRVYLDPLAEELRHLETERDTSLLKLRLLERELHRAEERIETLREEVEKLSGPPSSYGIFTGLNPDGTANVYAGGRKLKVNVHPAVDKATLRRGQELILNEALNVVGASGFESQGEVVRLKDRLDGTRAIVSLRADEERIAELADPLQGGVLRVGDLLLFDPRSGYCLERLPKSETDDLLLEEVPDVTYGAIGGLGFQIEVIRDALELPTLYAEHFREHRLAPPKGVLLYGPPGCGKTLIAKAVAHSLAERLKEKTGRADIRGSFINVKGPELLNKYVGETERKVRELFQRAKEKADQGMPVVIFFDEMDSLFRTRGMGISSDVESTIVPQFLAELDGVEGLSNVIVIGATNRQDLIDPAVLRPGRFDVKIKVDRPDPQGAREIFAKYLTPDLPFAEADLQGHGGDPARTVEALIAQAVESMYDKSEGNRFLEVTYQSGAHEVLYFRDFVSGAMIASIVTRAKKAALKRLVATGQKGITAADLLQAVREEFRESEELPNTANPDEWARIAGRPSERVVAIRPARTDPARPVETVHPGQYL